MRVLIVKMSSLGDVIHALPALDFLHTVSPGIEIDWVVEEPFLDVLAGNQLISHVYPVRTKAWRKHPFSTESIREIGSLKKALRERSYDIVFDLQGNLKSGLVAWLSGVQRRFGFDRDDVREPLNLLFTNSQVPLRRQDGHVTSRSLRIVSVPFGKDYRGMSLITTIFTSPEDDAEAEMFVSTLSDGLIFVFHNGTTWQTKLWHEEGWVQLGKLVLQKYHEATILLSWGNEQEKSAAERIATGIGDHVRILPRMSLKGFCALLKKTDLMVGGDTGPVHLAAAVGTPTASFYRATDATRNGPSGEHNFLLQSPLHCCACLRKECDRDLQCRESIRPDAIMAGIERLFPGESA